MCDKYVQSLPEGMCDKYKTGNALKRGARAVLKASFELLRVDNTANKTMMRQGCIQAALDEKVLTVVGCSAGDVMMLLNENVAK
eukprot:5287089-Pleurochrysis_carterae.AAC.1